MPNLYFWQRNPKKETSMNLNMKVLVVDDFATMRRISRNIHKQIGFTNISEADDGKTAFS